MKTKKRISSIVILRIICIITLLTFPMMSLWGNYMAKEIDYETIMNQFTFFPIYRGEENDTANYIYEIYPSLEKTYHVDENIQDVQDLIEVSENVAIVTMKDYEVSGEGLLATFHIEKIIKSDTLKENDSIKIYDMVAHFSKEIENRTTTDVLASVGYIYGNVPLIKDERYIVFFDKSINALNKDTYMYSSLKYGSINITKHPKIAENFKYGAIAGIDKKRLKEVLQYDMIFYPGQEIDHKEIQLYKEVYDMYKEYALH